MIYPKNLTNLSTIGIVALSAGVGEYIEEYKKSIKNLEKNNFFIIETASVRNKGDVSNTPQIRAKELDKLVIDEDVDMVMCAAGGDFLYEILPYVNYENIKKYPKWIMGASDPTSLLYIITTSLDIATIYGFNAGSYDQEILHESQKNSLEILKGNLIEQKSFDYYEKNKDKRDKTYNLEEKVYWENLNGNTNMTGRIIGGCIDCLRNLPGTKYDNTKKFLEKYKYDGIIWYFDIFSLTSEEFYLTLLQLKEAGWFNYTVGVVVGRVMFPNSFTNMTYQQALIKIFENVPIIFNADIGHVAPKMTIINGSMAHIVSQDGKGKIELRME